MTATYAVITKEMLDERTALLESVRQLRQERDDARADLRKIRLIVGLDSDAREAHPPRTPPIRTEPSAR